MSRERKKVYGSQKIKVVNLDYALLMLGKSHKRNFLVWRLFKFKNFKSRNADKSLANPDKKAASG